MATVNVNHPYGTVQLGGYLYIASQQDNMVYRVNASDLSGKTSFYSVTTPIGLTTDGTYLYVTRAGNSIYQITQAGAATASGAPWLSTPGVYYLTTDTTNENIYASISSNGTITKIPYDVAGNVGTPVTNWSTGYTSPAEMFVNNANGLLYVSDDNGVYTTLLGTGGTKTLIINLSSSGGASGNQSVSILDNYLYVGTNNAQNISVYNYPGYSLVSNNWKVSQGNISNLYAYNNKIYASNYGGNVAIYEPYGVCFLKGTKILCENGYTLIENLKPGDLVKTLLNGYVPIDTIKSSKMYNSGDNKRTRDRLYILSRYFYKQLFEDLIVTGPHSVLVDSLTLLQQQRIKSDLGHLFVTDKKYRLPVYLDNQSNTYRKEGTFDIYHICLKHENEEYNYGIFANGLLVESCCKKHIN
jgi:hypothetical protein